MADNEFTSERGKLAVQVENDHVYLYSKCCGCGDEMTDPKQIEALRDELTALLVKAWSPDVPQS